MLRIRTSTIGCSIRPFHSFTKGQGEFSFPITNQRCGILAINAERKATFKTLDASILGRGGRKKAKSFVSGIASSRKDAFYPNAEKTRSISRTKTVSNENIQIRREGARNHSKIQICYCSLSSALQWSFRGNSMVSDRTRPNKQRRLSENSASLVLERSVHCFKWVNRRAGFLSVGRGEIFHRSENSAHDETDDFTKVTLFVSPSSTLELD